MRAAILAVLWVSALAAGAARAQPVDLHLPSQGYTYFNRPGSDITLHDRELFECALEAAKTMQPEQNPQLSNQMWGWLLDRYPMGGYAGLQAKYGFAGSLENCMVVRGWRVVRLDDGVGRNLAKLSQPALAAALQDWVGSVAPPGEIVRTWNNDALLSSTGRFHTADQPKGTSLSFLARAPQPDDSAKLSAAVAAAKPLRVRSLSDLPEADRRPLLPLKPKEMATIPPDLAVIVIRLRGYPVVKGTTLFFNRIPTDSQATAWSFDNVVDNFKVGLPEATYGPAGSMQERTFVVAVPPGRWALTQASRLFYLERFCLGAPAFDVGAGDVVFAGTFDLSAQSWAPDMNPGPVSQIAASLPGGAERLKAASWRNGNRGPCFGAAIYNLEIPGAPYVEGYTWGGAAPRR